ncbi:MAG: hypothetical protein L6W00_10565 [Lentisphaeria bacterium]|nr:MAG: hypothetical protein L6W00_10565 [Lentisphaeria bacterium]
MNTQKDRSRPAGGFRKRESPGRSARSRMRLIGLLLDCRLGELVQHLGVDQVELEIIHSAVLLEHVAELLLLVAVVAAHVAELGVDLLLVERDLLKPGDLAEQEGLAQRGPRRLLRFGAVSVDLLLLNFSASSSDFTVSRAIF